MASVRSALSFGVDAIEFDLHRSSDGVLVVIHDFSVDRTTDGAGSVSSLSFAELQRLDAGAWYGPAFAGERIPSLEEFVAAVPAGVRLFLELKAGDDVYPGIEEQVAAFLVSRGLVERTNVSSFDHFALLRLRTLLPEVETGMLYAARPINPVAMAQACQASAIHCNWESASPELVSAARAAGLAVNAWTPNTAEAVAHCRSVGVDGIITDRPELV